jgi:branched-chain amino acid transport system permease protein
LSHRNGFIAAGCAAVLIMIVPFAHNSYLTGTMVLVAQNALAALGLGLLIGTARVVSVAQAAFFGVGAYAAVASSSRGLDPWLSIAFSIVVVAAIAAIVGWPVLRLRGHYITLATLALGYIAMVTFNEAGAITGGPSGFGTFPPLHWGAQPLSGDLPAYILGWLAVAGGAAVVYVIRNSARGRALRAIAASETAAAAMGVQVRARKLEAFVLAAVYAGVAGALYAYYVGYISPVSFSFDQSIYFIIMVVLGGSATTLGPVIGAILFSAISAALTQFASVAFPSNAQSAAAALQVIAFGLILIGVIRFLPGGIVNAIAARLGRSSA